MGAIPFSHSYGFSSVVLPALMRGALIVVPDERSVMAPLAAARDLEATFFPAVPAWLSCWARLASPPPLPPSVRLLTSAGAPLSPETARAVRERFGRPVQVFYGASECGGIAFDREGTAAEQGTVGTPVEGVAIELDAETGRLRVRSAAVAEGYLPEPASELAGGSFLTGDLAAWDEQPPRGAPPARPGRRPGHRQGQERAAARGRESPARPPGGGRRLRPRRGRTGGAAHGPARGRRRRPRGGDVRERRRALPRQARRAQDSAQRRRSAGAAARRARQARPAAAGRSGAAQSGGARRRWHAVATGGAGR